MASLQVVNVKTRTQQCDITSMGLGACRAATTERLQPPVLLSRR